MDRTEQLYVKINWLKLIIENPDPEAYTHPVLVPVKSKKGKGNLASGDVTKISWANKSRWTARGRTFMNTVKSLTKDFTILKNRSYYITVDRFFLLLFLRPRTDVFR